MGQLRRGMSERMGLMTPMNMAVLGVRKGELLERNRDKWGCVPAKSAGCARDSSVRVLRTVSRPRSNSLRSPVVTRKLAACGLWWRCLTGRSNKPKSGRCHLLGIS
jgi:hypothetical protein